MPEWAWVLIALAVVAVVGIAVWRAVAVRRSKELREQFGPEYERATSEGRSRREAEKELAARQERREQLNIRSLSPEARERYAVQWERVQAQFVDSPPAAIAGADALVATVMTDRGYPMDDFEQRAADVSVDHPNVVDNYRLAHEISTRADRGEASTEDLRQAMQHYRSLFDDLLGDEAADRPLARDDEQREERLEAEATTRGER
jgi:hypothetical protein